MGLFSGEHPDVSSGSLYEHSFHKLERGVKSIFVNILENFFSKQSKAFESTIPELTSKQNIPNRDPKVFIKKDFPYNERQFPMIVTAIKDVKERKAYIGSDDLLHIEDSVNEDGIRSGVEMFAGMADIDLSLIIVTTSPEERSMLAEAIFLCFTHYYRNQYIYLGSDQSLFSLTPSTKQLTMGAETEITDESQTTMIYVKDVSVSAFIEYQFKDFAIGKLYELRNINYELNNELNVIEL